MVKSSFPSSGLSDYFRLQFTMANRKLKEFGIPPILGFALIIIGIIVFSLLLFNRIELAPYIIVLVAVSFISPLSDAQRSNFLKSCFDTKTYYKIRLLENGIIAFPFLVILAVKGCWFPFILLGVLAILLGIFKQGFLINRSIPTPFGLRPFEFAVGFRKTILIFPLIIFLMIMGISVDNFNLGIFSILLVFVVCLSYYSKPENKYYVWIDNGSPKAFLRDKILTSVWYAFILGFPLALSLVVFYPANYMYILLAIIAGEVFLITMILAKYSAFPQEVNIPQAILFALSLFFPPMLLVVIPIFYIQSIKRLDEILT